MMGFHHLIWGQVTVQPELSRVMQRHASCLTPVCNLIYGICGKKNDLPAGVGTRKVVHSSLLLITNLLVIFNNSFKLGMFAALKFQYFDTHDLPSPRKLRRRKHYYLNPHNNPESKDLSWQFWPIVGSKLPCLVVKDL